MNKQTERLISADKLLIDLNEQIDSLNDDLEYANREGEEGWANEISHKIELLSLFVDGILSGRYKPESLKMKGGKVKEGEEVSYPYVSK